MTMRRDGQWNGWWPLEFDILPPNQPVNDLPRKWMKKQILLCHLLPKNNHKPVVAINKGHKVNKHTFHQELSGIACTERYVTGEEEIKLWPTSFILYLAIDSYQRLIWHLLFANNSNTAMGDRPRNWLTLWHGNEYWCPLLLLTVPHLFAVICDKG